MLMFKMQMMHLRSRGLASWCLVAPNSGVTFEWLLYRTADYSRKVGFSGKSEKIAFLGSCLRFP